MNPFYAKCDAKCLFGVPKLCSMISENEYQILQQKIDNELERKRNLELQVHRIEKDIEAADVIKSLIPNSVQEKEREESEFKARVAELERQIDIYDRFGDEELSKEMKDLEIELGNSEKIMMELVEKTDNNQELTDDYEKAISDLREREDEINKKLIYFEKITEKYEMLNKKIPSSGPLMMKCLDTLKKIEMLENGLVKTMNLISFSKFNQKKFMDENALKLAELNKIIDKSNNLNESVKLNETKKGNLYLELSNLTFQNDSILIRTNELKDNWKNKLGELQKKMDNEENEFKELNLKVSGIEERIKSFPEIIESTMNQQEILISKKNQLLQQIKKKIEIKINEITKEYNESSKVINLSKCLELQWNEHEQLQDKTNELEKKLQYLQDNIERKRIVYDTILKQKTELRAKKGIEQFNEFYSIVEKQNRAFGEKIRDLQREITILEDENNVLKRKLSIK